MSDFFNLWLRKPENYKFWQQPLPSERLDRAIIDPPIQKAIAANRNSQLFYSFIENTIVTDYANLINVKLREAFKSLDLDEFLKPSGFELKEKSSIGQQYYYKLRNYLEYFLKQDIKQQDNPDAQLNAFRRWINISEQLLKQHCYEGFLLIFVNVQLLAKPHLIAGLPESTRAIYLQLCELSSAEKNHSALRKHYKKNKNEQDLFPLLFWHHAIGTINQSLEQINDRMDELNKKKIKLDKSIAHLEAEKSAHRLRHLKNERKKIRNILSLLSETKQNHMDQRENILDEIKEAKDKPVGKVRPHLQDTFIEIIMRYDNETNEQARRNIPSEPSTSRISNPSSLYSEKLLPSFWGRRGKSPEKHWDAIFQPNNH